MSSEEILGPACTAQEVNIGRDLFGPGGYPVDGDNISLLNAILDELLDQVLLLLWKYRFAPIVETFPPLHRVTFRGREVIQFRVRIPTNILGQRVGHAGQISCTLETIL